MKRSDQQSSDQKRRKNSGKRGRGKQNGEKEAEKR
jgi:hypothetical protein